MKFGREMPCGFRDISELNVSVVGRRYWRLVACCFCSLMLGVIGCGESASDPEPAPGEVPADGMPPLSDLDMPIDDTQTAVPAISAPDDASVPPLGVEMPSDDASVQPMVVETPPINEPEPAAPPRLSALRFLNHRSRVHWHFNWSSRTRRATVFIQT